MTTYHGCEAARRQIGLLYGDATDNVALRMLRKGEPAQTMEGPLDWEQIERTQQAGYQIYLRPNLGGWKDAEITHAIASFVDADDKPMPGPLDWHIVPDFVVSRSPTRWQAWWTLAEPTRDLAAWTAVQLRLAKRYDGDDSVANPCTLMRLAGTLNLKAAEPVPYTLTEFA